MSGQPGRHTERADVLASALRQYAAVGTSLDLPTPKRTAQEAADLLDSLAAALREAEENLRVREQSQIPVIPRGAKEKMDRLESALAEIVDRHERPCGVHEAPLPCDVALAETYGIARAALRSAATGKETE